MHQARRLPLPAHGGHAVPFDALHTLCVALNKDLRPTPALAAGLSVGETAGACPEMFFWARRGGLGRGGSVSARCDAPRSYVAP